MEDQEEDLEERASFLDEKDSTILKDLLKTVAGTAGVGLGMTVLNFSGLMEKIGVMPREQLFDSIFLLGVYFNLPSGILTGLTDRRYITSAAFTGFTVMNLIDISQPQDFSVNLARIGVQTTALCSGFVLGKLGKKAYSYYKKKSLYSS